MAEVDNFSCGLFPVGGASKIRLVREVYEQQQLQQLENTMFEKMALEEQAVKNSMNSSCRACRNISNSTGRWVNP